MDLTVNGEKDLQPDMDTGDDKLKYTTNPDKNKEIDNYSLR